MEKDKKPSKSMIDRVEETLGDLDLNEVLEQALEEASVASPPFPLMIERHKGRSIEPDDSPDQAPPDEIIDEYKQAFTKPKEPKVDKPDTDSEDSNSW